MKVRRLSRAPHISVIPFALTMGADGEENGTSGGATGANGDNDEQQNDKVDPAQKKIAALNEEKDRHFAARTAAEKERDDALAKIKEFEDKDKTEFELAQSKVSELTGSVESMSKVNQALALENAFLKDSTYEWQDSSVALQLVDLSSVKIEGNKVTGLQEALKELAEKHAFLLKKTDSDDEDKSKDDKSKKNPPPSGDAPGSRRNNDPKAAELDRLRKKYPALRQH